MRLGPGGEAAGGENCYLDTRPGELTRDIHSRTITIILSLRININLVPTYREKLQLESFTGTF